MNQARRRITGLTVLAAAVTLLAACGSSSSSSSTSAAASTGASTGGSTITVGSAISVNSPILDDAERKAGVEAAISDINASGGVNGHMVKLDFCDTQYNPNQELACARKLVSDKVAAVINPDFLADQSGRAYMALAQAGIPIIGDSGLSPAGMVSPDSFPLSGGLPGWTFGAVDNLLRAGAKKVAVVADTNPASQFAAKLMEGALAEAKLKPAVVVTADPSSDPTLSSAAAKATGSGVDGIAIALAPTTLPKIVVAIRQAGYKGPISSLSAIVPDQIIQALKSAANGILLSSQTALVTDTANPGVAKFLGDMKKYQPGAVLDERTETGWAAMELFAKATSSSSSFTPKDVLQAMSGITTPIDIGIIAPYKSVGATSPVKTFPRIFNPTVTYGVVKNGKTVPDQTKGFPNPFINLATGK